MQVILLENIKKLGAIGEKVTVKDGYARNFLLKNKKALVANKKNTEYFDQQKSEINKKNEIEKNKANATFQILNNVELEIYKEAMENGLLYGSINIKEIVTLIKEQKNLDISAEKIEIKGQLKNTGISKVYINLHAEVIAAINLNVKPKVE
ncbi:LSU ribosomal protein L9p [Candidatus Pelagibacter sp. IMCC9063]|uniref:50S ribosomal protein L9 n=1 Tax=Pelagibacter sp. (strain IMCC9063) TaxID=1002672 RepID=UPI00020466C8|nr:50S ribosomal protein L9 [Candidatus Pelagibacter sp. IMCC9063]AEA81404.1 LSU ribosomal protein L9p [Candidatus Pelagibacter sp. IMCC9063]